MSTISIETLDNWARNGIHISTTTPNPYYCKYYVARFIPINIGAREPVWQHLYEDGWHPSNGSSWYVTNGSEVRCPTFVSISEAVEFALRIESKFGSLTKQTPVVKHYSDVE